LIALVALREPVFAANLSRADQAKLSSLQQKIDELDRAGRYRDAIPLAQDALKLVESTKGPESLEAGTACDKLGALYLDNGDYAKAEPLYQRALRISEKVLGREHGRTGTSLNNLAWLYYKMGSYSKAEPLYRRALAISEKNCRPGTSRHSQDSQ